MKYDFHMLTSGSYIMQNGIKHLPLFALFCPNAVTSRLQTESNAVDQLRPAHVQNLQMCFLRRIKIVLYKYTHTLKMTLYLYA